MLLDSGFYRIDLDYGDFKLIKAPCLKVESRVRAYHVELLRQVKQFENYNKKGFDVPFFEHLKNYYLHIWDLIDTNIDINQLRPDSRHEFFIAKEQQNNSYISGLELLMGYGYKSKSNNQISITTGDLTLDLIAELSINNSQNIDFLISNFSSFELIKICKQQSDRLRGEDAIKEKQQELDLRNLQEIGEKELQKSGFKFPF
jgi:hypothetical protein